MPTSTTNMPSTSLATFQTHLQSSTRIVALLGAGLSASSGLPTFRGAGGLWRKHSAISLATPTAFASDPALVWQFYAYRRHMALSAVPNAGHMALAALARHKAQFLTLSQNVDNLSPRAGHPAEQLKLLHGNLFTLKCMNAGRCGYVEHNNTTDPLTPALTITNPAQFTEQQERPISASDLPHCPQCHTALLRPGVVWFNESLPHDVLSDIDAYFARPEPIDLMLVVGTSSQVWPAAGYTAMAKRKGARVAVVNLELSEGEREELDAEDWFFEGDAAVLLPEMFKGVVGEMGEFVAGRDRP
jgi:NAD+-dependent protein deacetylase sirtuin 5